jgi:ribosome-binding protein aMBF1 (putative translation factor)
MTLKQCTTTRKQSGVEIVVFGCSLRMTDTKKPNSDRVVFGKNLKRARNIRGFSQDALAYEAGLSRTFVSDVERAARNLSIDSMSRLAGALGLPLKDLVDPERFSDPLDAD